MFGPHRRVDARGLSGYREGGGVDDDGEGRSERGGLLLDVRKKERKKERKSLESTPVGRLLRAEASASRDWTLLLIEGKGKGMNSSAGNRTETSTDSCDCSTAWMLPLHHRRLVEGALEEYKSHLAYRALERLVR
jgi:hypothetical protein